MDSIRIGRISAINYTDGTARIVYTDRDNAVTPELPLLSAEYCMPKVDDLVLVLHLPTGAEAGVILGRFWCDGNRPRESGPGLYRKDLSDDGTCYIKCKDGKIELHSPGGVQISGALTAGGMSATADSLTIAGALIADSVSASSVTAGGKSLGSHTHTDSVGGETSAPK